MSTFAAGLPEAEQKVILHGNRDTHYARDLSVAPKNSNKVLTEPSYQKKVIKEAAIAKDVPIDWMTIDFTKLDWSKLSRDQRRQLNVMLTPRMTKYIPHVPTPKQTAFLLLQAREAFYGGAAGGGKSDALLMGALQYVDIRGYAAAIFRKTYADLSKPGALIPRAREWLAPFEDERLVKWSEKDKKFDFLGNNRNDVVSTIQFGYMENDNDRFKYQGGEYYFIGWDELTHITEVCYRYLYSRTRKLKHLTHIPIRHRGASNPPEDDSGQWVYNRFVNPKTKLPSAVFISAGIADNPHIDKQDYIRSLNKLDIVSRRRLKDGVWDIQRKGTMFSRSWIPEIAREQLPSGRYNKVRFWDMASSDEEAAKKRSKSHEPDYTASVKMSEYKGIYYIEDIINIRRHPSQTQKIQEVAASLDGPDVLQREEQEPGSSGESAIYLKATTFMKRFNYKGIKSTGSKIKRAEGLSAAMERHQVIMVSSCRNKEALYDQLESFPGGSHDDMVDACSGAFCELQHGGAPEGIPEFIEAENGSIWFEDEFDDIEGGYGI